MSRGWFEYIKRFLGVSHDRCLGYLDTGGTMRKKSILFFGPLPPPYFGPSVTLQALLRSRFPEVFNVYFIRSNFITSIEQLGKYSLRKIIILLKIIAKEVYFLIFKRPDFVCSLISFNKSGFLKDMVIVCLAKLFHRKVALYAHGNYLPGFYSESNRLLKMLIKKTICGTYAVIVLGQRLEFNFEEFLPRDRIFAVPSGIEKFNYISERKKDSGDKTKVLLLSNIEESKGFFVLIQAIPIVVAQRNNVKFMFAGDRSRSFDKDKVFNFIRQNRIESFIEFKGKVTGKDKTDLYYDSDIFVFPTYYRYETFGLVILEAMQAGLPVITTARGAIPEIIEDGVNGFIIRERDPVDLAEKLIMLIDNEELRRQIGKNNIRKFHQYYTNDEYGERMIKVFNSF